MSKFIVFSSLALASMLSLTQCDSPKNDAPVVSKSDFGGFESQVSWGEHLVTVSGCHDCHSPKKMTPMGPDIDSSALLAGYMGVGSPEKDVTRKEMQDKGLTVTRDLTAWIGPWGVSYTANLTSDPTGIGDWTEEQFFMAMRKGKYKGLASSRQLLPPMPWQMFQHFTDGELKAIFAFLKSTKPIKNTVPQPLPPAGA